MDNAAIGTLVIVAFLLLLLLGSYLDKKIANRSQYEKDSEKVSSINYKNESIIFSIIITIFFSVALSIALYHYEIVSYKKNIIIFSIFYLLIHPLLGKVLYEVVALLCRGINRVYELKENKKWCNWKPELVLIISSLWPITFLLIMIPVTFVGVLFGWLFKNLFHLSDKQD